MSAHLTPKENYLRLLNGDFPEWAPAMIFGQLPGIDEAPYTGSVMASIANGDRGMGGGKDIWGVEWVPTTETGGAALPKPGNFILKDIRKWRDVIKAPSLEGVDWEKVAKKDLEMMPTDRRVSALGFMPFIGYYQTFMSFMGFNEGMCAMAEEPEEVQALLEYLSEYYLTICENLIDIYKPDTLGLCDDTAAERAPFISREMYRKFLLPLYDKHAKMARDRGIHVTMHNCGKSEGFFDDLVKIGVVSWDPVQLANDIHNVQAKFGRHLVLNGGWEGRGRLLEPDVTDEEIRQSVRTAFDAYAPNGGFVFLGVFMGALGDPVVAHKNEVVMTEAYHYGHQFYNH
jgi:hypothetical protein